MFDRVASRYDPLNSVMSAGLHHRWRERAADRAELAPGDSALDVCCGTGDLTLELAGRVAPGGHVIGCDFSEPMLDLAREKADRARRRRGPLRVGRRARAPLRRRPLRRGHGRLRRPQPRRPRPRACGRWPGCCAPAGAWSSSRSPSRRRPPLSTFYSLWFDRIVPLLGRLSNDPEAYSYLPESVRSFPDPPRPGGEDGRGRPRRDPVHGARRRDRRDPQRHPRVTRPSAVPPPVTAVLDASSRWLPARLGEVEELLREQARSTASRSARTPRRPWRPAASGCGRCWSCSAPARPGGRRRSAARPRSSWSTWRPWSTTTSSTTRRCAAAGRPSPPTSGRDRATAVGDLLFSRAFALLAAAGDARAIELLAAASVALARGELAQRQDAFDTSISEQRYLERCRLKTATLFECACLLGRDDEALGAFGAEIGLAFQLLDDVLDVAGPAERTGKARGTDLLDGTVTLPLIVAAASDPEIAARRPARPRRRRRPRRSATGSPPPAPSSRSARGPWRWSPPPSAASQSADFEPEQRQLLDLVADGVVQRYY